MLSAWSTYRCQLPPAFTTWLSSYATWRPLSGSIAIAWGLPVELVLPIESDGVTIAFLPIGESKIELVMPTDASTGVARFLESRGEGFHHLCLEVDDVDAELRRLAGEGIELIDQTARKGAEGPVAFIHPRSCHGVLVELIEATGGPAWGRLGY